MVTTWAPRAVLAIWNDCAPGREDEFERWYQDEHLPERLSIKGFRVGRRYSAVEAPKQYLTTYEVDCLEVLTAPDYLQRLAHPTECTAAIMNGGFVNAVRAICERDTPRGPVRGSFVLTVAVDDPAAGQVLKAMAAGVQLTSQLTHSEIWHAAHTRAGTVSAETRLRGPDATIAACLALEFLRAQPALRYADTLAAAYPEFQIGVFELMCTLRREDLQIRR